jgi:hypothetical protein
LLQILWREAIGTKPLEQQASEHLDPGLRSTTCKAAWHSIKLVDGLQLVSESLGFMMVGRMLCQAGENHELTPKLRRKTGDFRKYSN